jgi:hypothetical protein
MSLGIGLGAFMQGMGQGINLGRSIVQMRDEAAAREAAQGAYRQSSKEREVAIGNRMAGDTQPAEGDAPAPGGTAPVAAVQQEALAPPAAPAAAPAPRGLPAAGGAAVAARDPAVERVARDLETNGMPLEVPGQPVPRARGNAPAAVTAGIEARRALDPNSPTYAQDIARINDTVVGQTMGGARTPTAPPVERAAPAAAAPAGLPPLPASSQPRGPVSREQAEREVGSVFDFYMQRGAPRVVEQMLANGNVDGARQFQTWIRGEQVQRGMRSWAGAIRAAQSGDADGFLRSATAAYNNEAYSPDGVTATGSRVLRGDDGSVTGMELTLRNRDGTERVERFNGSADLYRRAISFLAPEQQFQQYAQELTAARTATTRLAEQDRTERLIEARERRGENRTIRAEGRGEERTVRTEGRANSESDRRSSREFQEALEKESNASLLRQAEAAARARGERPEDVRRNLETIRNNSAATNPRFSRLSIDEQVQEAARIYERQRAAAGAIGQPPRPGAGGSAAPPAGVSVWRPSQ